MNKELKDFFKGQIDFHVNGLFANPSARIPADVVKLDGGVTDRVITVVWRNGAVENYEGGRYAARKVNGCYAPLLPKLIKG
jgi:hypothetical protein